MSSTYTVASRRISVSDVVGLGAAVTLAAAGDLSSSASCPRVAPVFFGVAVRELSFRWSDIFHQSSCACVTPDKAQNIQDSTTMRGRYFIWFPFSSCDGMSRETFKA